MSYSPTVSGPKYAEWPATAALMVGIAVGGCAARKAAEQNLETCRAALSSCNFTRERLTDQNRRCRERVATPPPADPYMDQWRTTFEAAAVRTAAMFRNYTYDMEIVDGALVFSLPIDLLFTERKSKLTSDGREVVTRLSQVIKAFPGRKIVISCRSVDHQQGSFKAAVAMDRGLSLRRAGAIASKLGKLGVDQRTLVVAGGPGKADQTVGSFEFSLHPLPREMPAYPSDVVPEATYSAAPGTAPATGGW